MSLQLYNTLTRRKEPFTPLSPKHVGMYTCGPTVYSTPHIGNFRSYIFADTLHRALLFDGFTVKQVMNITDVGHLTSDADEGEDKLEKGARAEGQTVWDVAVKHTKEFQDGLTKLNILPPDVWAKATDHIKEQIALIEKLVANGHTYETPQAVYYDVATFKDYGQLSRQKLSEKKLGARSDVVTDGDKKHPADFALWFKRTGKFANHVMYWPSPWGDGFPGWHIECSAMSMNYLGQQFDIHTGGIDHIPVHHENEIAQSEGATGKHPVVKYWMHNEFLVLPGKRMGKSEGNAITLKTLSEHNIHPLAFRYLCLLTHYRKHMSFTMESLEAAATALTNVWTRISSEPAPGKAEPHPGFLAAFQEAIDDDLNVPQALGVMHELLADRTIPWDQKAATLARYDAVLGLDLAPGSVKKHATIKQEFAAPDAKLTKLLAERTAARATKDFALADELRATIESMGYIIVDGPDGPKLRQR